MKKHLLFVFSFVYFLFIEKDLRAQSLFHRNWVFGNKNYNSDPTKNFERYIVSLDKKNITFDTLKGKPNVNFGGCNTTISDKKGQLLFYSNGCQIYDWKFNRLNYSDSLNFGSGLTLPYCYNEFDENYILSYSLLVIPSQFNNKLYYLYHQNAGDDGDIANLLRTDVYVDRAEDSISIQSMNKIVLKKNLHYLDFQMAAVRHGNGKDWWITLHTSQDSFTAIQLRDTLPVDTVYSQVPNIFEKNKKIRERLGVQFSLDGTQAISTYSDTGFVLHDFNRCTGKFSNQQFIPYPPHGLWGGQLFAVGFAHFSPSGQYAYVTLDTAIYQYDLFVTDIKNSYKRVNPSTNYKYYYYPTYGPDNILYFNYGNPDYCFAAIMDPDKKASECNYNPCTFKLWTRSGLIPRFPNYDLGPDPCWVATEEPKWEEGTFTLSPNPAKEHITLSRAKAFTGNCTLMDLSGRILLVEKMKSAFSITFDVSRFPVGMYLCTCMDEQGNIETKKWVKMD